jgi:hypothetical protein
MAPTIPVWEGVKGKKKSKTILELEFANIKKKGKSSSTIVSESDTPKTNNGKGRSSSRLANVDEILPEELAKREAFC